MMNLKFKALRLVQTIKSRPRLMFSIALAIFIYCIIPDELAQHVSTRFIISWNVGAITYLALSAHMMREATPENMQKRAIQQNVGRWLVLCMVMAASLVCLASIVQLLSIAKDLHGAFKWEHIALAGVTVFTSWLFTQVMFAQHYAHEYYFFIANEKNPGLLFPGTDRPDYFDFVYFSCVIGTSAQTADVSFTNSTLRMTGMAHGMLAFFFNTVLIALTINIGSGLI